MNKRVLFIILIGNVFFLNSCSKSTSWPPEEQLFRDRLYRVVWDKADPRPWAEYFKQHPSWVEKHKKVMLLSPDVSAEEYLAMIYVSWEDWPNAQYFLEKGLAKKRSHYGLKMLINLAAQTQNAALLTSLSARERASFGVYYDIRQAIANRKYEQALVSLNLLLKVPPADRAPEKFAQSDNLLWYLKVLALTGQNEKMNNTMDMIWTKSLGDESLELLIEEIGKSEPNSEQSELAMGLVDMCYVVFKADKITGDSPKAEIWRERGLKLLLATAKSRFNRENVLLNDYIKKKFTE